MSSDLVAWYRQQLDEDERIAEAAPRAPWSVDGTGSIVAADGTKTICSVGGTLDGRTSRWPEAPVVEVVTTWHPVRVLREIDSKRQLLDEHADVNDGSCGTCVDGHWGYPTHGSSSPQRHPCKTLRLLALPYADRPGYREEWRP